MNYKLYCNTFLIVGKNVIKGLFPYIFSNYTITNISCNNNITLTDNDVLKCSKTKKKLIYCIVDSSNKDSLKGVDYIQNKYKYKSRICFHNELNRVKIVNNNYNNMHNHLIAKEDKIKMNNTLITHEMNPYNHKFFNKRKYLRSQRLMLLKNNKVLFKSSK